MKYIDADRLKAELKRYKNKADERLKIKGRTYAEELKDLALQNLCGNLLHFVTSLQQEQPDELSVPLWCLKNIENTLQIQHNIRCEKETGETCQDRNIKACLNSVTKILNGEELTGMERLEPLKQPEVDLDKEIEEWTIKGREDFELEGWVAMGVDCIARHFYELGLNARKED